MRMMAVFEKSERIRHIGHLDIQRSVQRGLRRSGLPVAYSNGFHPHILISFASALSTGAAGKREIMDVTLAEPVTAERFLDAMNRAMPPVLRLLEARPLADRAPALMTLVRAAVYDLRIDGDQEARRILGAVPAALARQELRAMRKTKTKLEEIDIRPQSLGLNIPAAPAAGETPAAPAAGETPAAPTAGEPPAVPAAGAPPAAPHLRAVLTLTETTSCKPGMLMEALSREAGLAEVPRFVTTRLALLGEDAEGRLIPLEKAAAES